MTAAHPWLASYPPQVDWHEPIRVAPLTDLLDAAARRFPDRPAYRFLGRRTDWAHAAREVDRVAAGLQGFTRLTVPLVKRGTERNRTNEDTIELVRKLAVHTPDQQIAAILNKQGRRTGTGLPFNQPRVASVRVKHGIPAAPPPDPDSGLFTVDQAAIELGVTATTIYRWLRVGLLPGEQTTPHAPWRIRLTPEVRARFVPDVPEGYLPLDDAAKRLGCARQTVLHKVQRGELHAVQVVSGRRKGLRINVSENHVGLFDQ